MGDGTAFILSLAVSWFWLMLGALRMNALLK